RQVISARIWARRKHIPAGRSTIRLIKAVARRAAISVALLASLLPSVGDAEEGGSGHYLPGSTADFLDILPGEPGFAYANFPVFYQGSAGNGRPLEAGWWRSMSAQRSSAISRSRCIKVHGSFLGGSTGPGSQSRTCGWM